MRPWRGIAAMILAVSAIADAKAQGTISSLPRKETRIVENPEGTIKNAGWFNIWSINAGGQSTGLHQLGMDTFWYIDPQKGVDGVWDNSLASDKPIYNADFTEMTVKLRKGIFWSDGQEFTADDVVFTIQTQMKTNGLRWSAPVQINVADISAPGMFQLAKEAKASHGWFKGFPYAHPDPTLPAVLLNAQNEMFKNRDVRWALALLIDIKAVSMASYRGAATISAIGVPPTGSAPDYYHQPLESWLQAFEVDTGKRKLKPYDPTIGKQIADMMRPSLKEQIPSDPAEIAKSFGRGWWKRDPQAAAELLER